MLVTPAFTFLSLAFNIGTLLLLHGSDPNLVTTKQNLRRSIQTIGSAATESWKSIAMHYEDILSPPAFSASSFSSVDRAEWIYRSCAVRILGSLDGSVSHSSRTSPPSLPLSPFPASPSFSSPALTSTSLTTRISNDITLYVPSPPACSISNAPFVVDYAEHPWETPGFVEMYLSRLWSLVLCVLVYSVNCALFEVVRLSLVSSPSATPRLQSSHHADTSDAEVGPPCGVHDNGSALPPSSYVGSVVFMDVDSTPDSNSELGMNSEPEVSTTAVDISSLPRAIPVVITTSDGRVLFNAEITLSSNHISSIFPSSVKFSVDVVAFRNLSPCKSHFSSSPPNNSHFPTASEDIRTTQNDGDSADSQKSTFISNCGESDIVSLPSASPCHMLTIRRSPTPLTTLLSPLT